MKKFSVLALALFSSVAQASTTVHLSTIELTVCTAAAKPYQSGFQIFNDQPGNESGLGSAYIPIDASLVSVDANGEVSIKATNGSLMPLGIATAKPGQGGNCTIYQLNLSGAALLEIQHSESLIPTPCLSEAGAFPTPELCKNQKVSLTVHQIGASMSTSCERKIVVYGDYSAGDGTCSVVIGGE